MFGVDRVFFLFDLFHFVKKRWTCGIMTRGKSPTPVLATAELSRAASSRLINSFYFFFNIFSIFEIKNQNVREVEPQFPRSSNDFGNDLQWRRGWFEVYSSIRGGNRSRWSGQQKFPDLSFTRFPQYSRKPFVQKKGSLWAKRGSGRNVLLSENIKKEKNNAVQTDPLTAGDLAAGARPILLFFHLLQSERIDSYLVRNEILLRSEFGVCRGSSSWNRRRSWTRPRRKLLLLIPSTKISVLRKTSL